MDKETLKDILEKLEEFRLQEYLNDPSSDVSSISITLDDILKELKEIKTILKRQSS